VYSVSDPDSAEREIDVLPLPRGATVSDAVGSGSQIADATKAGANAARPIEGLETAVSADEPVDRGASVSPYRFKLAPDYIGQGGGLYFSSGFGFGLANTIAMSDMLGNHRAVISFNIYRDIADSDLLGVYYFLKNRINYGIGAFQYKNYLNSRVTSVGEAFQTHQLFTERNYGIFGLVSYPFSTFNRMDLELTAFVSERQFFEETVTDPGTGAIVLTEASRSTRNLIEPTLSFVHDASFFSYFGPIDGSRYMISVSKGFGFEESGVSRETLYLDYRRYIQVFHRNSFAFRLSLAASEGDDPRTFFLGGPSTIRGYDYLNFAGTRFALVSAEYRFPFLDALIFGWPGRWGFGNMMGQVFFDAGAAWDKGDFTPFESLERLQTRDILADVGIGTRFYFGYFLLNFQIAWQTDFQRFGASQFYFFIGPGF
jgi:outer membrane protein assembly factor BamA